MEAPPPFQKSSAPKASPPSTPSAPSTTTRNSTTAPPPPSPLPTGVHPSTHTFTTSTRPLSETDTVIDKVEKMRIRTDLPSGPPTLWSPSAGVLIAHTATSISFFISHDHDPTDPQSPRHQPPALFEFHSSAGSAGSAVGLPQSAGAYPSHRRLTSRDDSARYQAFKRKTMLKHRSLNLKQWSDRVCQRRKKEVEPLEDEPVVERKGSMWKHQHLHLVHRLRQSTTLKRAYSFTFAQLLHSVDGADCRLLFDHDPDGPIHHHPRSATSSSSRGGEPRVHKEKDSNQGIDSKKNPSSYPLSEPFDVDATPLTTTETTNGSSSPSTLPTSHASSSPSKGMVRTQSIQFPIAAEERNNLRPDWTDLTVVFGKHAQPTITKQTLNELSLESIVSSIQIRHDLLFDPHLEFRINDDGDRGLAKLQRSNLFWADIEADLDGSRYGQPYFKRIPVLLNEIKEIMLELMANDEYKAQVESKLDIALLAQQMEYGAMNAVGLMEFIGEMLKSHCAPARDVLVDALVDTCRQGHFAKVLRLCFELLERMKLDVANDQMKRLRPYFLENAVTFEQEQFTTLLKEGKVTLKNTTQWLHGFRPKNSNTGAVDTTTHTRTQTTTTTTSAYVEGSMSDFLEEAYIDLISTCYSPSHMQITLPETFTLDQHRLHHFHNDWQDITIMSTLLMLFRQFSGSPDASTLVEVKQHVWVLLSDADTTMHHISLHLATAATRARLARNQSELSEEEIGLLSRLIDTNLHTDSKLFGVITKRIGEQLVEYMKRRAFKEKEVLAQQGLMEVEPELLELAERMKAVLDHNKLVYSKIYNSIIKSRKVDARE